MRKFARNALATAAVASAAVALTVTPASAAPGDWVVTNGGVKSATNVGSVIAENVSTGAVVTCTNGSATANIPNKSNASTTLGTVTAVSLTTPSNPGGDCDGPGGLYVKIVPQNLPWTLTGISYASPNTTGKLTGVKAQIQASDGCVADVTGPSGGAGTIDGKYSNSSGRLTVLGGTTNNLRVNSTNGLCDPLLINVNDTVALDGIFQVAATWPNISKI